MRVSILRYTVFLLPLLAGCLFQHDCYQLEVKPDGDALQRKLTCWHDVGGNDGKQIGPVSFSQLAALSRIYPQRESENDGKKHVFIGRFSGNTPADVGGAGSYTHFTSSMGSTSCYVERFRGDDDAAAQLAKRRQSAERLCDLLLGWMTAELGQQPGFPRLKKFLDEDLRRDLLNLALYNWAQEASENSQVAPNSEFLVRAGQYLCERGYFSPREIPMLLRALSDEEPRPVLVHVQRFLTRKMGIPDDQPIPVALDFLGDPTHLQASFDKYTQSTERFQKRLEAAKSQKKDEADSKEIEASEMADEFKSELIGLAGWRFSLGADSLDLTLFSGEKPYATNGKWDEKDATVTWSRSLDPDRALPVVCFALWSTPDCAFQEAHFGRVLLVGDDLAQYVTWYRSLKPDETPQWNQFVGGLKPGPALAPAVKAFRFSADPKANPDKPNEQAASLADMPRRLILDRLEAKPTGAE